MKKTQGTKKSTFKPLIQIVPIFLATYFALFVILYFSITPEQYDIKVGTPAPLQIKATKDVLDTVTTEALREAAANAVEPSYKSTDTKITEEVMLVLNDRLNRLVDMCSELKALDSKNPSKSQIQSVSERYALNLTDDHIAILLETDDTTLHQVVSEALRRSREVLDASVLEGQESTALKSIRSPLASSFDSRLTNVILSIVRDSLKPNMLIDETITEENRQKARDSIEPEMCVKDEVIVREGEIVTQAQFTMIASLGLLADDAVDVQLLIGIALLTLLSILSTALFLYYDRRSLLLNPKSLLLLSMIFVLVMLVTTTLQDIHSYVLPIPLGMMLITLLIDGHTALYINFMLTLLSAFLTSGSVDIMTVILMPTICSPFVVLLLSRSTQRTTPLLGGLIIALFNFLSTMTVGLFSSAELHIVAINAIWAASSGILSAILCIGILPVLEWLFNIATASKLIELSNPNQPLLRRLLLEASGTYHHSIIVANLAEAACTAIGANGLLARVSSYYHDIGKLKRPMYFMENQMGDNPHDRTDPHISTAILTAHPRDGVQLAQKERLPQPVLDIIRQHHGDTPVMYFYDKACKQHGGQLDISTFRYEGPRPMSREAAVVMLADTVEAATRALSNPNPEKIHALIRDLIRGKLHDNQLDDSNLTMKDLDKISNAFYTVLTGVFHERIEYPDLKIPSRSNKIPNPVQSKPKLKSDPKVMESKKSIVEKTLIHPAGTPIPSEAAPTPTDGGNANGH